MRLLNRFRNRRSQRVFVLGLDGMPFTLAQQLMELGAMPTFRDLTKQGGTFRSIDSVLPPVSSVAWASFMTGKNPGKHNIFGFVDRKPATLETFIPTSVDMKSETLWELLSRHGKHVVVINVPTTFPPRPVKGILISGFEAPSLEKATYPPELSSKLKQMEYRIDIDPWQARQSRERFVTDLFTTFDKRRQTILHFMDNEPWDFFVAHIMDTDRLHHFLWNHWEAEDAAFHSHFIDFYRRIDDLIAGVAQRLSGDDSLVVLSDHGFCSLKREVFVNHYLTEQGWLKLDPQKEDNLGAMLPESIAYSLIPGRVYLNRRHRERDGWIEDKDADTVLDDLSASLRQMRDPDTGDRVVSQIFRKEEAFSGPWSHLAPELVLLPREGYDLKGNLKVGDLFGVSELAGMHTFENALLFVRGHELNAGPACVTDVMPTVLELLSIPAEDIDGKSLLCQGVPRKRKA